MNPVAVAAIVSSSVVAVFGATVPPDPSADSTVPQPVISTAESDRLAHACSAVLDGRDHDIYVAGTDAALEVVARSFDTSIYDEDESAPTDDELIADLEALRGEFVTDRDELAALDSEAPAEWGEMTAVLDRGIEVIDVRIEALHEFRETGEITGDLGPGGVTPSPDPDALAALGLTGRDCERIATNAGPPSDEREFVVAAAAACSATFERRRDGTYLADRDVAFDAVIGAIQGEDLATPEIEGALESLIAEWQLTADDFLAVDATTAAEPAAWQSMIDAAESWVAGYTLRLDAVRSGDPEQIAVAFAPGSIGPEGAALPESLRSRDCGSLG